MKPLFFVGIFLAWLTFQVIYSANNPPEVKKADSVISHAPDSIVAWEGFSVRPGSQYTIDSNGVVCDSMWYDTTINEMRTALWNYKKVPYGFYSDIRSYPEEEYAQARVFVDQRCVWTAIMWGNHTLEANLDTSVVSKIYLQMKGWSDIRKRLPNK